MNQNTNSQTDNLFNLKSKVIIITGALGLLGQKHVEVVAQNGGTPIIIDIDSQKVELFAKKVQQKYDVNALGLEV